MATTILCTRLWNLACRFANLKQYEEAISRLEEALAILQPHSFAMQVIDRDSGWPLPWYFRTLDAVGYQTTVPDTLQGSIIIVDSEQRAAVEAKLAGRAYESSSIYGLRPNVMLVMFVEQGLWDLFLSKTTPAPQRHD